MAEHATYYRYTRGCRCSLCTAANTDYHRARRDELMRLAEIGRAVEQIVERGKA